MKSIYQFVLFILIMVTVFACHDSSANRQNGGKKNDIQNQDTSASLSTVKNLLVDKASIKKTFLEYLPNISGGRKLTSCTIIPGDLNGDNLIDGVVRYGLEPTVEDNGGGGNAIGEFPGLIAFTNTGKNLVVADHSETLGIRTQLKKISKGVIILERLDYAADDPRCCPSDKRMIKVVLRNNKLVEMK